MKNLATSAKLKLTKTVITRYTKPQASGNPLSTSDLTVRTTVSVSSVFGGF
jgi:hypothetical protein